MISAIDRTEKDQITSLSTKPKKLWNVAMYTMLPNDRGAFICWICSDAIASCVQAASTTLSATHTSRTLNHRLVLIAFHSFCPCLTTLVRPASLQAGASPGFLFRSTVPGLAPATIHFFGAGAAALNRASSFLAWSAPGVPGYFVTASW